MKKILSQNSFFLLLMIVAMLFWGEAWISGKIVSSYTSSEIIVFWRFLLALISFLPYVLFNRKKFTLSKFDFLWVFVTALIMVGYNKLFFEGLKTGLSGKGGVIVTTLNPLFTFAITILFLKQRVTRMQIAGLMLGFFGGFILLELWNFNYHDLMTNGNGLFVVCAFVWAILTIVSQYAQKKMQPLVFSFYAYLFSTPLSLILAWDHEPLKVLQFPLEFWFHIIMLSVFAISFGTTLYFIASRKLGSNKASSFTFLVPFTAVILSWIFLNEQPTILTITGGTLALGAIYIINFYKTKKF